MFHLLFINELNKSFQIVSSTDNNIKLILNEDNIVTNIIVGKDENDQLPENFSSWEEYYGGKRCSYNTFANTHSNNGKPFNKFAKQARLDRRYSN